MTTVEERIATVHSSVSAVANEVEESDINTLLDQISQFRDNLNDSALKLAGLNDQIYDELFEKSDLFMTLQPQMFELRNVLRDFCISIKTDHSLYSAVKTAYKELSYEVSSYNELLGDAILKYKKLPNNKRIHDLLNSL